MPDPQQPFGHPEPEPISLAEQIECVEELAIMIRPVHPDRAAVLDAVLATLREVDAGEAGEP